MGVRPASRALVLLLLATACGTTPAVVSAPTTGPTTAPSGLPSSVQAACGHPGARAEVPAERRTVPHAECDLTGVVLTGPEGGGVTVPAPGTGATMIADGTTSSSSITATTARNGDVTYEARGGAQEVQVSGYLVLGDRHVVGAISFASPDGYNGGDGTRDDGSFTTGLLPGHYVISGTSDDDKAVRCRVEVVVTEEPVTGLEVPCSRP